jgi:hypothetical protein
MICTKAENFGEWKKAILKLCKISKRCTYDVKTQVISFHAKVEHLVLKMDERAFVIPDPQ